MSFDLQAIEQSLDPTSIGMGLNQTDTLWFRVWTRTPSLSTIMIQGVLDPAQISTVDGLRRAPHIGTASSYHSLVNR